MRDGILGLLAICVATLSGPASAHSEVTGDIAIRGGVDTAFDQIGLEQLRVSINGYPAHLSGDGSFRAELPVEPYYRVEISGGTIYDSIQTFGIAETYEPECGCLNIPSIGVVARKPGRIEVFFAGDVMAGRRYSNPIWGERPLIGKGDPLAEITALLEPMRPYIEGADLASINLEIVLAERDPQVAAPKSVVFFSPPELAVALAGVGVDHVSLGNNHSYDYLEPGLIETIAAIENAGLAWSGAGLDEEQALEASRLDVGDIPVSLLGYVGWKGRVEPNQVAEPEKGGAAYGSDANIERTVMREAQLGRTIFAQYHGSREYSDGPTEDSERRMKLAIDRGAALVASHHPHVAQGLELYNGGLIAYSSGNFLFDQYFIETHGSFALKAWLDHGRVVRAEVIPIRVLDYRPVPATGTMRSAVLDRVTKLSRGHGTHIGRNGGHGLILPALSGEGSGAGGDEEFCEVSRALLRGGDFENAVFGDARDRSLKVSGGTAEFAFRGTRGHVMQLKPGGDARYMSIAPSTFFRVVPGDGITVSARIRSDQPLSASVMLQQRPNGMARFAALEEAPWTPVGEAEIVADDGWVEFRQSFTLPPGDAVVSSRHLPFRPALIVASVDGAPLAGQIEVDDFEISAALEPVCNR